MAAQSVSWFPPEVAWTLPGKSLDTRACSDSQTVTAVGWWHHLSRACSLLAWVAKQRMLSCGFFSFFWSVEPSLFVRLCVLVSFYQPKMLLCAAGILSSLAPVEIQLHRPTTKRLRRRDFVASPLTLAHIPFLLPCARDWKCNIVWQWRLSLSCWSRLNAATHSVPGIWMAGTWTSCIFRSLKPSTEVTFC